jgi:hypothetical protein
MLIVPTQAVPNQTFSILLGGQSCQITLTTRFFGLFFDLTVNNNPVRNGVICLNLNRLIRYPALGFIGDFWFTDTLGSTDPVFSGLGANGRYLLEYWEATDVAATAAAQAAAANTP